MREVLNQSSDDDDQDSDLTPQSNSLSPVPSGQSNFAIGTPEFLPVAGSALKHPTRSQILSLYSSFMTNVDLVVKILHGPSLRRFFVEESGVFDCSPGPKGWEALQYAIYYTATTSMTPDECLQRLGEEKPVVLRRFRSSTELALAKTDFVNTEDVSTLQALLLYLFALRSNENSRRTWTLTSLAVRIAHALGLHRERGGDIHTSPYKPFEREMRRRLWWQICVLDRHGSIDRGSDPIVASDSFSTRLPLSVHDEDLVPDDRHEVHRREEFTVMTLSLVTHEVFDTERRLNYVPAGDSTRSTDTTSDPWAQRRGWVVESQQRMEDKYLRHCDMIVPAQRYTKSIGDIIIATLWLYTYRPLQRRSDSPTSAAIPPPDILHLSIEVVEKALRVPMDSSSRPYIWISTIWVQWHALAVMIAELCVQTEGATVERAWNIVDTVFEESARHIADSDKGRLWRPIKKLMSKAQSVRRKYLEDSASRSRSMPIGGASKPIDQTVSGRDTQLPDLNVMQIESEPKLLGDTSGFVQQPSRSLTGIEPMSFNWDQGVATGPPDQMNYNNELDQMAWTNWETFLDDFHANGEFLPGSESVIPPPFNVF
ncbi:MAG: hypothetical protein M1833_002765 [Piccolia ochrophora]|nr:MAG: hypothetical protein M1833_002765 [Piccolia ochrophora]